VTAFPLFYEFINSASYEKALPPAIANPDYDFASRFLARPGVQQESISFLLTPGKALAAHLVEKMKQLTF